MVGSDWWKVAESVEAAKGEAEGWAALEPLLDAWRKAPDVPEVTVALVRALGVERLARERRLELAAQVLAAWRTEPDILVRLGEAAETIADRRYLNAAPPQDPFFEELLGAQRRALAKVHSPELLLSLHEAVSTVARLCGRRRDEVCEASHRELLRLRPNRWQDQYNFGLFLKNRGRFAEGVWANQRAAELGGASRDSVTWNLGICATGAGEGQLALKLWRDALKCRLELGTGGLPEGPFEQVQVRLAERPVAARSASEDDPGREETIWVERLSPCHGRVRSALWEELGTDYGDLVLFDGAPILHREWDGVLVPVFPQLATLERGRWRIFPFAGVQARQGQLENLELPGGAVLYSHTERVRYFCRDCWERTDPRHVHEERAHPVVRGKLCVPPEQDLAALERALRVSTQGHPGLELAIPRLMEALGDLPRAGEEARRYEVLVPEADGPTSTGPGA